MDPHKKRRLQERGWRIGTVAEFLKLPSEEAAYVEVKVQLATLVHRRRLALKITQAELARRIESSQSRVAKMEAADESVSIDLLVRSLLALGASTTTVRRMLPK